MDHGSPHWASEPGRICLVQINYKMIFVKVKFEVHVWQPRRNINKCSLRYMSTYQRRNLDDK